MDDNDSGQQMKIDVKTKIKYKGQEYSSVEELPPEVRAAYEKAMATGDASACDVGPTQQIIESADPVPSVAVAFQDNPVFAGFVSATVVLSKKIDQQLALCQSEIGGQRSASGSASCS